jgi:hypothetical protein
MVTGGQFDQGSRREEPCKHRDRAKTSRSFTRQRSQVRPLYRPPRGIAARTAICSPRDLPRGLVVCRSGREQAAGTASWGREVLLRRVWLSRIGRARVLAVADARARRWRVEGVLVVARKYKHCGEFLTETGERPTRDARRGVPGVRSCKGNQAGSAAGPRCWNGSCLAVARSWTAG